MLISIPTTIQFADLKLGRSADGMITFDWQPIFAICESSNIEPELFSQTSEDNVSGLIIQWYAAHKAAGGEPDAVAEELFAETLLEDQHGGGFSYQSGKA
ncbi:hypothetical protein HUZ36_04710 [Pseudoalteromonas sp. McH1-7]|uniref:hypothetical protein n=1 Tax=Pseudoalteromonas sp. McH1-7 TaxID=2745574 RepID=UPI001591F7F0|nr:hypothetical protein [Pseudoalteromonas sp. McH1-7]NUZ10074.1 hypothetical protein [Pseudoalteromonas sp. McH1-7]